MRSHFILAALVAIVGCADAKQLAGKEGIDEQVATEEMKKAADVSPPAPARDDMEAAVAKVNAPPSGGINDIFGMPRPKAIASDAKPTPTVLGSLQQDVIAGVVDAGLAGVKLCAADAKGVVVVKWVINGEGRVTQSQVSESSLAKPEVEGCVADVVKGWRFPGPKGGGIVIVSWPFTLP